MGTITVDPGIRGIVYNGISKQTGVSLKRVATFVNLPGASGDFISTPDSAATSITSDIDLRWYGSLNDWTPPTDDRALISKWLIAGNQKSYLFRVTVTTGVLALFLSGDGAAQINAISTAATGFVDGTQHGVRVTLNNTTDIVQFFTRNDNNIQSNSGWTQLGGDRSIAVTGIFDSSTEVTIGGRNSGTDDILAGNVRRAIIKNGINGTTVADFNAENGFTGESTLVSSTTGEIWTINGNAALDASSS